MRAKVLFPTVLILAMAGAHVPPDSPPSSETPSPARLKPIPARGVVPPIPGSQDALPVDLLERRAKARDYSGQIRAIRRQYFVSRDDQARRAEGIELLKEFTDPASFRPLLRELAGEDDDVQLALLDHLASCGEEGQGGLAIAAIHHMDPAIRNEAVIRMTTPPSPAVLAVLDTALRSPVHEVANNAGNLAGALNALPAVPLLIFGQVTTDKVERRSDLAVIKVHAQTTYVERVEAVTSSGVGAYRPVVGVVNEGSIMRVSDGIAYFYRTEIHRALVSLTTADWGRTTDELGYDMHAWWLWYNQVYVPFWNERAMIESLAGEDQAAPPPVGSTQ